MATGSDREPQTIIRHVHALTMDDDLGEQPDVDIMLEGSTILDVGPDLQPDPDATAVDGSRYLAMPGLIDTHRHLWMSIFRGWPQDGALREIQQELHHEYGVRFRPEDSYTSASVSLAGAIWVTTTGCASTGAFVSAIVCSVPIPAILIPVVLLPVDARQRENSSPLK